MDTMESLEKQKYISIMDTFLKVSKRILTNHKRVVELRKDKIVYYRNIPKNFHKNGKLD